MDRGTTGCEGPRGKCASSHSRKPASFPGKLPPCLVARLVWPCLGVYITATSNSPYSNDTAVTAVDYQGLGVKAAGSG
jgi:hypothetical protein